MIARPVRALVFCLVLAACGHVDFDATPAGRFDGTLFVMWVGEGDDTGSGRFLFVPNPRDPLRLVRNRPGAAVQVIEPGMMYTDGGSIPRAGQLFEGLSPWGYAPAYMVHDWLFVARHCLSDGTPTDAHRKLDAVTFQDSAEIIAEAIKGLIASGKVQGNDIAPRVISGAVAGPVSLQRWTVRGECSRDRVSEADRAAAMAAIPGASAGALAGLARRRDDGRTVPVVPAQLISTIGF